MVLVLAHTAVSYREPSLTSYFPLSRNVRQLMPPVMPAAAAVPMYIPVAVASAAPASGANETAVMVDEKLKSTQSALEKSLDDKLANTKKAASEDLESKLEGARSKAAQDIDNKLHESSAKLAESVAKSESSLQSKLDALQNQGRQHLSDINRESNEKLDRISQQLNDLSKVASALAESSKGFCRAGSDKSLSLTKHHEELKWAHTKLLDDIRASMNESLGQLKETSDHDKKVRKDEDIKRNIDVRIEAADDENPAIGKLLPLTPIVAARKLRQIWNAQMGKGMVSVCYHNQPKPMSADHPLVDNDDPMIQSIFNGTMDSAHNLQSGLNLDVPSYINSLLMEVRSLDREFVSLCLEDPQHDVEFYHKSSCMNLVVTRKS